MAAARNDDRDPRAPRRLSGEDAQLWRRAVADVSPMSDAGQQALSSPPARVPVAAPPSGQHAADSNPRPVRVRPPSPELAVGHAPGLDRRTVERLRRGRIPPQARIDLHQQTQQEARRLLDGFLAATQANGLRCVLVITGKGYGSGGVGVMKTMVPRWLNEPPNRARILAFCHAVPAQGGEGALYVLLRRSRTPWRVDRREPSA